MKKIWNFLKNVISIAILVALLCIVYQFYQKTNYNDFSLGEAQLNVSEFSKDSEVKYSDMSSYKIKSDVYNDAMYYFELPVEKNTPYRITCMVKTSNVVSEENISSVGAQISILDSTERSVAISGTSDWQEIELIFNSKNRDTVQIAFRLGGSYGYATGEAWFSDFKVEQGTAENNSNWKFACFIFENTDVTVDGEEINIQVTSSDITDIKNTINRFESTCYELSEGKMTADCDIYQIQTPITSLSYDEDYGYYVAPEDVENQIKDVIDTNDYDHIFVIVRLGNDEYQDDIEVNDWIGLGSMDYYGIGYSNIRLPNSSNSYIYKYDVKVNQFPEEVFLHEFLHSLERNATEYGYSIPELHAYSDYGYVNDYLVGQKKWYTDYMNKTISTSDGYIGLPSEIYTLKPAKKSNFVNAVELEDVLDEPENIFEEIQGMFSNAYKNLKSLIGNS